MLVQNFYYRLREFNKYVLWLPGNEQSLSDPQLKQAFYDAMPAVWKECLIMVGKSAHMMNQPELLKYFQD